jgi:hypothetical protein
MTEFKVRVRLTSTGTIYVFAKDKEDLFDKLDGMIVDECQVFNQKNIEVDDVLDFDYTDNSLVNAREE